MLLIDNRAVTLFIDNTVTSQSQATRLHPFISAFNHMSQSKGIPSRSMLYISHIVYTVKFTYNIYKNTKISTISGNIVYPKFV